jgi:hypothetical protein
MVLSSIFQSDLDLSECNASPSPTKTNIDTHLPSSTIIYDHVPISREVRLVTLWPVSPEGMAVTLWV